MSRRGVGGAGTVVSSTADPHSTTQNTSPVYGRVANAEHGEPQPSPPGAHSPPRRRRLGEGGHRSSRSRSRSPTPPASPGATGEAWAARARASWALSPRGTRSASAWVGEVSDQACGRARRANRETRETRVRRSLFRRRNRLLLVYPRQGSRARHSPRRLRRRLRRSSRPRSSAEEVTARHRSRMRPRANRRRPGLPATRPRVPAGLLRPDVRRARARAAARRREGTSPGAGDSARSGARSRSTVFQSFPRKRPTLDAFFRERASWAWRRAHFAKTAARHLAAQTLRTVRIARHARAEPLAMGPSLRKKRRAKNPAAPPSRWAASRRPTAREGCAGASARRGGGHGVEGGHDARGTTASWAS